MKAEGIDPEVFMQTWKLATLAAGALVVATSPGYAADAQHGLDLAKRWCAACHLVSPDQKTASADVPPFATIARSPHFSARALAYFLLDPHPKMPDLPLSRNAANDIAAYIESLRK
jgi:mono/diheme cytochrome c family protein